MNGKRIRGSQKKRWKDNIKEWTGMDSTRAAEDRTRWKGLVARSSKVPQRPARDRMNSYAVCMCRMD